MVEVSIRVIGTPHGKDKAVDYFPEVPRVGDYILRTNNGNALKVVAVFWPPKTKTTAYPVELHVVAAGKRNAIIAQIGKLPVQSNPTKKARVRSK